MFSQLGAGGGEKGLGQHAGAHVPAETGSAASYTSTCRSHDVTGFSAPTGSGRGLRALPLSGLGLRCPLRNGEHELNQELHDLLLQAVPPTAKEIGSSSGR